MSKLTLTNLANLQNENTAVSAINANNAAISTFADNSVSRDGSAPNSMNAQLDMNSNRIINLPAPISVTEPLRYQDLIDFAGSAPVSQIPVTALKFSQEFGGRLTLLTGVGITVSDVVGATAVYYTPTIHNSIMLFDGTNWLPRTFSELTLTLDSNSGHTGYQGTSAIYDLFIFDIGGGVLKLGSGPAWSSTTSRGTGAGTSELESPQGTLVNKNSILLRYGNNLGDTFTVPLRQAAFVGTMCMTADGQTEDSQSKRFLSNAYNSVPRTMRFYVSAPDHWDYSTSAWAFQLGSGFSRVSYIHCLPGRIVRAMSQVYVSSASAVSTWTGIGVDSGTPLVENIYTINVPNTSALTPGQAFLTKNDIGIGRHDLYWCVFGGGSGTQHFYFNFGNWQSVLIGDTEN